MINREHILPYSEKLIKKGMPSQLLSYLMPIKKNKVYIIPTKQGLLFALVSFIQLLIGNIYENNLILLLSITNFTLFIMHLFITHYNILGAELEHFHVPSDFLQSAGSGHCTLKNIRHKKKVDLTLEIKKSPLRSQTITFSLKPKAFAQRQIPLSFHKRGVYSIDELTLSSRYPLGLFYAWKNLKVKSSFYIYPSPRGLNLQHYKEKVHVAYKEESGDFEKLSPGPTNVLPPQSKDDFKEHRKKEQEDSFTFVDWKVYAKRKKLLVKTYEDGPAKGILFSLEDCPPNLDKMEEKLSQLCLWLLEAHKDKRPFGLKLKEKTLPVGRGDQHLESALQLLAQFQS